MSRIVSTVKPESDEFRRRYRHNRRMAQDLKRMQEAARSARPKRDIERLAKQGKMLPRERLEKAARSRNALPRTVEPRRQHGL